MRLLGRMSTIMRSGSGSGIFNTSQTSTFDLKANKRSLNQNLRKQNLVKITIENHKLLKRLESK